MFASLIVGVFIVAAPSSALTLNEDACLNQIRAAHADLKVADLQIELARATLKELESTYYPNLKVTTWAAPMFTVEGGALDERTQRRYTQLDDWGPYLHFETRLTQVLSTFGRIDDLTDAAHAKTDVERAKRDLVDLSLTYEARRLILAYRLTLTLEASLNTALDTLEKALNYGRSAYDTGAGDVTNIDVARLEFGLSKAEGLKARLDLERQVVHQGLRFMLHLAEDEDVHFSFKRLPSARTLPELPALETLLSKAKAQRPEWRQINRGRAAYTALLKAESRNRYLPYAFAAGEFRTSWAPTRDNADNPYHFDPYNEIVGGAALGLQWDLDWAKSHALSRGWEVELAKVDAQEPKLAAGIAAEVRSLHEKYLSSRKSVTIYKRGARAARKWMISASVGFPQGTVSARDLIEGAIAFTEGRFMVNSAIFDALLIDAELDRVTGTQAESFVD